MSAMQARTREAMPTRKRLAHVRGRSVSLGKKGVSFFFFCLFF